MTIIRIIVIDIIHMLMMDLALIPVYILFSDINIGYIWIMINFSCLKESLIVFVGLIIELKLLIL